MFERYNERQKKIEEGIFPSGEITNIQIKEQSPEKKMICLAYAIRQLVLNGRNVVLVCRDTPAPVAEDWIFDFGIENETESPVSIRCMENETDFMQILCNAENGTTVIADFNITEESRDFHPDFQRIVSAIRARNISFAYTTEYFYFGWNSGIISFNESTTGMTMRAYTRADFKRSSIETLPVKWYDKDFDKFYDLVSLKYECSLKGDIYLPTEPMQKSIT